LALKTDGYPVENSEIAKVAKKMRSFIRRGGPQTNLRLSAAGRARLLTAIKLVSRQSTVF
jgi:hypothetical protein